MMLKLLIKGLATYIPGFYSIFSKRRTGGTISARYCYSVWLRHLLHLFDHGQKEIPSVVAELGPGDSLGIGLAALVSGAECLYSLDVVDYFQYERNVTILNEVVDLFRNRANIPDDTEFPLVKPSLDSFEFPGNIFPDDYLEIVLDEKRINSIKHALTNKKDSKGEITISYFIPWDSSDVIETDSIDIIISQAVLEHVNDLDYCYNALYKWLKVGGIMSHQIDFKCHKTANEWNGHWTYSDMIWRLIRGKRPFLINRQPLSVHINLIRKHGFEIIKKIPFKRKSEIKRDHLASSFKNLSDEDLNTSGVFIQARKLR